MEKKIYCEDCKWYTNAWGYFDCYYDENNIYYEYTDMFGVKGIKRHNWDINKNNDCEWFEINKDGIDIRDLLKRCRRYDKDFKIGGKII